MSDQLEQVRQSIMDLPTSYVSIAGQVFTRTKVLTVIDLIQYEGTSNIAHQFARDVIVDGYDYTV